MPENKKKTPKEKTSQRPLKTDWTFTKQVLPIGTFIAGGRILKPSRKKNQNQGSEDKPADKKE